MNKLLKMLKIPASILPMVIFLSCSPSKDYYSLFMENGCQPRELELTPQCEEAIRTVGNLKVDSFTGEVGKVELDATIRSIHRLLVAPILFPKEGKLFGLGTLEEAGMTEFINTFLKDDHANVNQLLVNNILNATPEITFGCTSSLEDNTQAAYSPWAIHICGLVSNGAIQIVTPGTLLHEARHQYVLHTVECNGRISCDKGMDGAWGWEVALDWGLLEGARAAGNGRPSPTEYPFVCGLAYHVTLEHIFAVPLVFQPAKVNGFINPYVAQYCS